MINVGSWYILIGVADPADGQLRTRHVEAIHKFIFKLLFLRECTHVLVHFPKGPQLLELVLAKVRS